MYVECGCGCVLLVCLLLLMLAGKETGIREMVFGGEGHIKFGRADGTFLGNAWTAMHAHDAS